MRLANHKMGACSGCRRHVSAYEGYTVKADGEWKIFCAVCDPPAPAKLQKPRASRRECPACGQQAKITAPATVCDRCRNE
jgi:hypothetical protein